MIFDISQEFLLYPLHPLPFYDDGNLFTSVCRLPRSRLMGPTLVMRGMVSRTRNHFGKPLNQRIAFLHIPKCAGVSVDRAIKSLYRTLDVRRDLRLSHIDPGASHRACVIAKGERVDETDSFIDDSTLEFREKLLLYHLSLERTLYVSGHFAFSQIAYDAFKGKYCFITILRDPVDRFISQYVYDRYKSSAHCKSTLDIDTYLESPVASIQGCTYVRFLGGRSYNGCYTGNDSIEQAKRNLSKCDIVGCVEHMHVFVRQFRDRFGLALSIRRENESPKDKSFAESLVTKQVWAKIEHICEPDFEIYRYAVDKLIHS